MILFAKKNKKSLISPSSQLAHTSNTEKTGNLSCSIRFENCEFSAWKHKNLFEFAKIDFLSFASHSLDYVFSCFRNDAFRLS